jgi:hypothetical protein
LLFGAYYCTWIVFGDCYYPPNFFGDYYYPPISGIIPPPRRIAGVNGNWKLILKRRGATYKNVFLVPRWRLMASRKCFLLLKAPSIMPNFHFCKRANFLSQVLKICQNLASVYHFIRNEIDHKSAFSLEQRIACQRTLFSGITVGPGGANNNILPKHNVEKVNSVST